MNATHSASVREGHPKATTPDLGRLAYMSANEAPPPPPPVCFVVMPITVAAHHLERYENRDDHYEQIFRSMIQPAVELAGLQVSAPKREGTENIQAGIINDLQSADLVLADLSGLNPNVFLELGIRSALDKPVCLVWDGADRLPFDTGTLSTHRYNPKPTYELNDEIENMADHIAVTLKKSDGRNELWKFFGRAVANLPAAAVDPEDASVSAKIERLLELAEASKTAGPRPVDSALLADIRNAVTRRLDDAGEDGVSGQQIGSLVRRYLGGAYDDFLGSRPLSRALVDLGIPLLSGASGVFYHSDHYTAPSFSADESLEAILKELKERGIGRSGD